MTRDRLLTRRWRNSETQAGCPGACVISVSTRYRRTEEGDWRRHVSVSLGIFEAVTVVSLSHAGRSCRVGTQGGEDIEGADVKAWSGGGPQERRVFRHQMLVGHNRSRIASFLFSRLGGLPQFTEWKIEMLDVQASIEMTWTRGSAPCDVVGIIDREQYYLGRE